jgi:arabinan endo-1,5-alpha-L-arabinosidase
MNTKFTYSVIVFIVIYSFLPNVATALDVDIPIHDPSTIIKEGNKYWMFTTGDGINAVYSTDLYQWRAGSKTIFPKGKWPAWINNYVAAFNGYFWAPDVIFMNGKYYLFYSCSAFGGSSSVIGVATCPTLNQSSPDYDWKDLGMVVSSSDLGDINAIDPSIFKDTNGKLYLTYGSYFDGIGVIEMDTITGKVKPGAKVNRVAGGGRDSWEASCLIKEGSYYYLFANRASCCNGFLSTYFIVTGRSTSPTGPFRDKNGIDLRGNNTITAGSPVMVSSGKYVGPGHFGLLRDNGRNIVSMHYYDRNDYGSPKLDLSVLQFTDDGWPVINRNCLTAGKYKITNTESKLVWEAPGCAATQAKGIILNTDHNSDCQEWDVVPIGDGYYKISNGQQNMTLDVPACNSSNAVNLQEWNWLNNDCQKFKIDQLANGQYVFTSLANQTASKVIQFSPGVVPGGNLLSLFDYKSTSSQEWTISRLPSPTALTPADVSDSGFTVKWTSIANVTSYRLDVFTTFTNAAIRTIAGWDFQAGNNSANTGLAENLGKTITSVGTNQASYNTKGNGGQTAQATGWQADNTEKYWEINFTTAGYYNLRVSSKQRSSSTGPRHFKLQYKIGNAGTYSDIPEGLVSNLDNYTAGVLNNITLPEECENQPSVYLRWLLVTGTNVRDGGIESSAQSNIDDIKIIGNPGNFLPGYNNLLVNDTAKRINALPPGTDFFFRVRSEKGTFTSINSNVVKVTTTGITPVNFASIAAAERKGSIEVDWKVVPENNVVQYEVEKSINGQWFTQIGRITARSGANASEAYNYLDINPNLDNNFYRIKAVLASGIAKYSPIAKVYIEKGQQGAYFYPNPLTGTTISLYLFDRAAGINDIRLINSVGQEVFRAQVNHAGGSLNLTLPVGNLSTGIYHFVVNNGNSKSTQTIMVTNN